MLCHNIDDYIKRCNVYLALKTVQQKPYSDLQFLTIPIHC